ncbi:MAG: ABC transporter ATP-binding protein [Polyangiaceae bacterium]|nr:ABC transporter ATP-binding protein [Polyangiaceae bacterium]
MNARAVNVDPALAQVAKGRALRFMRDGSDEPVQRPISWAMVRRLYDYSSRHKRLRALLFVFVAIRAVQVPLVTWIIGKVVGGPIAEGNFTNVLWGVAAFVGFELFTEIVCIYRSRWAMLFGEAIVHDVRNDMHRHIMSMPLSFFQKRKVGRFISRMTSDVDAVRTGVQDVVFVSVVQAGQAIVGAVMMAYYDWKLFLVMLALVPILWAITRYFRSRLIQAYRQVQESFSRVTATLVESVTGIRVIQGFVREKYNGYLFEELIVDHSTYNMQVTKQSAAFLPLLEFNGQLFLAVLLVLGGFQALHGDVSLATIIQFLFMSNLFFSAIPAIGGQYTNALTSMAGAERVFDLLDTKPDWSDTPSAQHLPTLKGRVEFRDVSFEYAPGRPVLRNVSFSAEPGQTIALVGPTGSGKSTLIKLVGRLYLPSTGAVLVDGVDSKEIHGESFAHQVGTVPQDNFLFSGTVRENIRMSRPEASDADVENAVRSLGLWDLVSELPKGFDTDVGEGGGSLSLGQRQLICFARALLPDPRIIILDEATSSVDAVTEARLQLALQKLLAGRTSFVIAHRLSTIRHADTILVMRDGEIIERGKHAELVQQKGAYFELHRQFIGG